MERKSTEDMGFQPTFLCHKVLRITRLKIQQTMAIVPEKNYDGLR